MLSRVELTVYGHAPTSGSRWDFSQHKLIISAGQRADATPVSSVEDCPGCAQGAPQTLSIVEWAPPAWPPDTWITSPDLSPLLRELLDAHGGLQAGAHLQLWLRAPEIYTENAELAFEDLDAEGGRAAVLTLRWSALP